MQGKLRSIRQELTLNVLWFSINTQYAALVPIVIPTQVLLFVSGGGVGSVEQATFLAWLTAAASVVSLLMPPLIGRFSDRTTSRFGRRRPYIALGGLLLLASTPFLVSSGTIVIFLVGLSILHIGNNIVNSAYQSLVPDRVPEARRGEASGFVGAMTILGNVAGLGLAAGLLSGITRHNLNQNVIRSHVGIFYLIAAAVVLAGLLITLLGVHEVPLKPREHAYPQEKEHVKHRFTRWFKRNWVEPWHSYNFTVVFLTRSSIMMGLALFMTFIEYYFARVQHLSNFIEVTAIVAVLSLGGGVVSGILSGIFSDRLPRRAPLVSAATISMSITAVAFVIFPSSLSVWLWPLGILFGLGYGVYMSVDWALSIDALPSLEHAGKDLGLWDSSVTLPAILAPLLGSLIINVASHFGQTELGYRLVFTVAAIFLVVAAICVLFVRERKR
ncbi:MAG TPA: MFS transporter [Ktedonobacteraceae bacterium]|nr:MFS transporter [Ktedonobacteraceae bacterium]